VIQIVVFGGGKTVEKRAVGAVTCTQPKTRDDGSLKHEDA
jgi:hypothetical protein